MRLKKTGDKTRTLIASTANPYKFSGSVLDALGESGSETDEFELVDKLKKISGMEVPRSLAEIKSKKVRFVKSIDKSDMKQYVLKTLA